MPVWSRWAVFYDDKENAYYIATSRMEVPDGSTELDFKYADDRHDALRKLDDVVERHRAKLAKK